MISRSIEKELTVFYEQQKKEALLISGARQVGKTFIIRETAKRHFANVVEINFIKNPKAKMLFNDTTSEQDFFTILSTLTDIPLERGKTLVFFDEVQECPEVVTFIKFLVDDGRFKYVLSGSLLGIELKDIRSVPVGYMREIQMFPLDFREFVIANHVTEEVIGIVKSCYESGGDVPSLVHDRLMRLFRLYLVVGGMPAAVQIYLDTNDLRQVARVQNGILVEYKRDAAKYDKRDKMRITRVMELIPSELNRENKRFYATDIKAGERFERLEDNFVWLTKAGIALPVYNVTSPRVPIELARKANLFKLFMNDVGLLACQYADGIQLEILSGLVDVNFGAVYENFIAQELHSHGYETTFYFNSKRHGEIDFIIEKNGAALPIEAKSGRDYKRHVALDKILAISDFAISTALVLSNSPNVEIGRIKYAPVYSTMFIKHDPMPDKLIYRV